MKTSTAAITAEGLRASISYDAETGEFRWRVSRGRQRADAIAGTDNGHGYLVIRFNGVLYMAHRLAWMYVYGCWPSMVDHANGDRHDNRIANLRLCDEALNAQNQRRERASASGRLGVHRAHSGRWKARIKIAGREKYLGTFVSIEQAAAAYESAKRDLHPFAEGCRG